MQDIIIDEIYFKDIDLIKGLWEELNNQHLTNSKYFKKRYENFTFNKRKKMFIEKINNGSKIYIDIAKDKISEKVIGYCISTVAIDKAEIDSICIDKNYRKQGIGDKLFKKALTRFEINKIDTIKIDVAYGNEEVFGFYEKYGFYPKYTILEKSE